MLELIKKYIGEVLKKLELNSAQKEDISKEINSHLLESAQEYLKQGLSHEEAQKRAVKIFGSSSKIARKLQWIHGFGRFSENRFLDALLGTIPFILSLPIILLVETKTLDRSSYFFALFWIAVIIISTYALLKGVPCWTVTWLGFLNVIILQLLFFFSYYLSPILPIILLFAILIFLIYLISRKDIKLTLLFLLPLAIPYVLVGYDDVIPSHRIPMGILVVLFTIVASFILLYFRLKFAYLIGALGFCLYTFVYFDIIFNAPLTPPLEKNYLGPLPTILGYIIPLLIISAAPVYLYLKEKYS
ncbi:MAG: permease prefix domain 1-containing protein [Candidatus Aminicenantia bacterium]